MIKVSLFSVTLPLLFFYGGVYENISIFIILSF
jgi:hypothetical protein